MKRVLLCLALSLAACLAYASAASAAHVQCGDVITQNTTLDSDLLDCPANGVVIGADFITLDLAGHTIDGVGSNAGGWGVDNDGGHDGVRVLRGRIQDFQSPVYFDHANGGLLRDLTIPGGAQGTVQLWNSDFNTIARNVISTGITLYDDSDGNTIHRNQVTTAGTAILIAGGLSFPILTADGNRVTGNRLIGAGSSSYGIYVGIAADTLIQANDVRDQGSTGISVNGFGPRNQVVGNAVVSSGEEGIALNGQLQDSVLARNHVTGSDLDGIRLERQTQGTVVERNNSSQNGDDGIDSDSASATLTGNKAKFNDDLGIEAVPGVTDGGGNKAKGNGNPAQCVGVACS